MAVRLRFMRHTVLFSTFAAALLLATPAAHALFKVIGPDGRVTYTDRPPLASEGRVLPVNRDTGRASDPALPLALRQVATRFPVTLYTASNCGEACALGRNLLSKRGVPFTERTAETDEEREAWTRLVGGLEAPVLKVGEQQLRGYTPVAWDETLDVAGYPRQSTLPVSYQAPAPIPLLERRPAAPPPRLPPSAPVAEPGSNPSSIRF
jgi:glutaredoxin